MKSSKVFPAAKWSYVSLPEAGNHTPPVHPASFSFARTSIANDLPTSSLSETTSTWAPARAFVKPSSHLFLPAPPGPVVAIIPNSMRASASFSPSTTQIGSLFFTPSMTAGRL